MNTQEMIAALRQMLAMLEQVNPDAEPAGRPGMVAVRPTGARGGGVVHWWPAPQEAQGENGWGYMSRMSRTKNPATGLYYFPPQLLGSYALMQNAMPANCPWPEQADRMTYHDLWLTQEELDREAAALAQWGVWGTRMGG